MHSPEHSLRDWPQPICYSNVMRPTVIDEDGVVAPPTPDILIGAYLLDHLREHCEGCGTSETPQWRKGWTSFVTNDRVRLCNACGLKYLKHQNCFYCHEAFNDIALQTTQGVSRWIRCGACPRVVHVECELRNGYIFDFSRTYHCPKCRSKVPFEIDSFSIDG